MTEPPPPAPRAPRWPGRMITLSPGPGVPGATGVPRVWIAETSGPGADASPDGGQDTGKDGDRDKDLVLCVHGMSGAASNWADLMGELAGDFDCVALDLPGSGFSAPPAARFGYSITAQARTVIALIETLTAARPEGRVHLIGNSLGGAVAVRAAASRPDLIKTLTLVSPALPDRPLRRLRRATAHFPVISLPVAGPFLLRRYARLPAEDRVAGVFAACYYDPAHLRADQFALEVAELRERDKLSHDGATIIGAARTLVGAALRPRRFSLWDAAERVSAPALVMFGQNDRLVSPRLAAMAARAFPDARVVVLPLTGHIAQMERPALVAARFREMVATTGGGDGAARGNSGRRDPVDA